MQMLIRLRPSTRSEPTHVTIDARMIAHSGIGTYIRGVLPHLIASLTGWRFSLLGDAEALQPFALEPRVRVIECRAPIYSLREQVAVARRIPDDSTVFWAPHYNVPLLCRIPLVVTVHDLAHLRLAEYATPVRRGYARAMLHAVRRRAAVMFVSDFTRKEFETLIGTPSRRHETIHPGLSADWLASSVPPASSTIPSPYFAFVGNAKPHKGLGVLLDAFLEVRDELGAKLIVMGATDGFRTGDKSTIKRLQITPGVVLAGQVDIAHLRAHLRGARALVLPSVYEGFGFPPLEAMAVGCPAIVARAGSLPEVCGDAAAYFSPANTGELAGVMRQVVRDNELRQRLVRRGTERAQGFRAERTAARIGAIISSVAGNG
jgi:glycosyltransferase involved in cell wall biosynthesis